MKWHKMKILIVTRTTKNFLLMSVAMKLGLMLMKYVNEEVELANGQIEVIKSVLQSVDLSIGIYKENIEFV